MILSIAVVKALRRWLLAVVAGASACAACLLAVGLFSAQPALGVTEALFVFVLYFVGALIAIVLFALPLLFVLRAVRPLDVWSMLVTGALVGVVLYALEPDGGGPATGVTPWLIAGVLSALAAWLAWQATGPGAAPQAADQPTT